MDDGSLPLDEGRALPAHLLDAHEEFGRPGTVYLFCKVCSTPPLHPILPVWTYCARQSSVSCELLIPH